MKGRRALVPVALVAATVEIGAAFLPWARTGTRERTSFELIRSARRLDVLQAGTEQLAASAWYFAPLVVALAWLALALHRRSVAAGLAGAAGVAGLASSLAVRAAPVAPLWGTVVTVGAAVVTIAAATIAIMGERRT